MDHKANGPHVTSMQVQLAAVERLPSGTVAGIHGLDRWLISRQQPGFTRCPVDRQDALIFRLDVAPIPLADLLQAFYLQPWRAPGKVELHIHCDGGAHTLTGLKQIVEACSKIRGGRHPWWPAPEPSAVAVAKDKRADGSAMG